MLSREEMRERPLLDTPRTVRIKFKKTGASVFISHLDLQRTFNRCLLRSGVPAWYTKGFNPHAKLVFSPPLPLGCDSVCELCDIKIEREVTNDEIFDALSHEFTDEMRIIKVYTPRTKLNDIMYASYEANIICPLERIPDTKAIRDFFTSSPCPVIKKTKSGDKETDIALLIESFVAVITDDGLRLAFAVGDGKGNILSPELIIKTAIERFSLFGEGDDICYTVSRTGLYGRDKTSFI